MMGDTGVLTVSQSLIGLLPLLLPAVIGFAFLWVIWHTESWHLLRRRIWQITHGSGEITDNKLKDHIEEQTNLAAFRIFVGLPVNHLRDGHTLMEWCRVREVDLGKLRMCGSHFDVETRRIKSSEGFLKWGGLLWGLGAVVMLVAGTASLMFISSPYVLLSVKSSGQRFLASEAMVRSVQFPQGSTLTAKKCIDPQTAAAAMPFASEDTAVMCELLAAPEYKNYVRENLSDQRFALFILGLTLWVGMYLFAVAGVGCAIARKLLKRGVDPAAPVVQMELEFEAPR